MKKAVARRKRKVARAAPAKAVRAPGRSAQNITLRNLRPVKARLKAVEDQIDTLNEWLKQILGEIALLKKTT